jgi:hypothetical protein
MHRRARGQATVELALGMLVFITVLVFAIHFAEVGYLSVKVTEAAHSAALDAALGRELHRWANDETPSSSAASASAGEAQARYADFDSRTTSRNPATHVFTQAQGLQVRCTTGAGLDFAPHGLTDDAYSDNGGMSCVAEANIRPAGMPTRFLDDNSRGGFFRERHYSPPLIRVCSMGRALGGNCGGELKMILDDWGLAGDRESAACLLTQDDPGAKCANTPLWDMAEPVFQGNGASSGTAASNFVQTIVGAMPPGFGGEDQFWLSATGESTDPPPPETPQTLDSEGHTDWDTSPGMQGPGTPPLQPYDRSHGHRRPCFLGNCRP